MPQQFSHDVLIIGSGAAGLTAALKLAPHCKVAVTCKGEAKRRLNLLGPRRDCRRGQQN